MGAERWTESRQRVMNHEVKLRKNGLGERFAKSEIVKEIERDNLIFFLLGGDCVGCTST